MTYVPSALKLISYDLAQDAYAQRSPRRSSPSAYELEHLRNLTTSAERAYRVSSAQQRLIPSTKAA